MAKKQFYGITYPFTSEDSENYFIDLNSNIDDKIKSLLMHLIFTPKGQKIRDPEFGTDLIKFIFDPNDDISIEGIKTEVSEAVRKYINGINIINIQILTNEDSNAETFVRIDYSIDNGIEKREDSIVVNI